MILSNNSFSQLAKSRIAILVSHMYFVRVAKVRPGIVSSLVNHHDSRNSHISMIRLR